MTDLRGLDAGSEGLFVKYLTLEGVDLRFARGNLVIFQSEFFDCRFDDVVLTVQPRFNRRFERCSFRGSRLNRLTIGPGVIDCDFTNARASRLRSAPNTVFERCLFDGVDFSGATFSDTHFVECSFIVTRFSETTTFERCSFRTSEIDFGPARVMKVISDGDPIADQWAGESAAQAAEERFLRRYVQAVQSGEAHPLTRWIPD
jgi:uncharacterized protein YjbI with pentapeptide repeats